MNLFLRKDRPWIVGLAIAGGAALGIALINESPVEVFAFGAHRLEAVFHVAWIAGLVFGCIAACFDEGLGTREFLAQRPLSRSRIFAARLLGVVAVLAVWFVAAPFFAWLLAAYRNPDLLHFRAAPFGLILAMLVVAVSAAAIAFSAGLLPLPWWQRLVVAGAWFVATFGVIHAMATSVGGYVAATPYVVGHLIVAAAALAIAAVASRHDADPDRPWAAPLRRWVALPSLAALSVLMAALVTELQGEAFRSFETALPRVARHAGEFVLFRSEARTSQRYVVDRDHRPTGEVLPHDGAADAVWWGRQGAGYGRSFYFEEPRWSAAPERVRCEAARFVLTASGRAFTQELGGREMRDTGRGAELAPFTPGSQADAVGDAALVVDAATGEPWRFDPAARHFVRVAMPAGERCDRIGHVHVTDAAADRTVREMLRVPGEEDRPMLAFVRGRLGAYTVHGSELVLVPGLLERVTRDRSREHGAEPVDDADPLVYTLELPADGSPVTFRHEFRPRTAPEWFHAGTAMVQSLLRPAVLQVAGSFVPMPGRAAWLFDRLTVDGRRPWLVFAVCLFAGVASWRFGRRLHALGADRATVRWWRAAIVLFGPVAVLAGLAIETPRRHARRGTTAVVPPPRIVSAPKLVENIA